MNFNNAFYHKKVFLTGHTGFKGSWMTLWLELLGAKVKGYALQAETISLYNRIKGHLNVESILADIRNSERLEKEIGLFQPDFLFHFAAQPLVRESYKTPVETFEVNAIGTANVLNALRKLKKPCAVVIVTTDKVYKNPETGKAFPENAPLGGHDPYSASKAAAEIVTESFRLSFFPPSGYHQHKKSVATARAGNVIGGGDYAADRLLPDIFRALSMKARVKIRNPYSVRPWQHVLEPLSGYLMLAAGMKKNPEKFATSFNFGSAIRDTLTVEKVVNYAIQCWGSGSYSMMKQKNAPHEAGLLKLNINKAKQELGWQPVWNARQAIEKTIGWYHDSLENKDLFGMCIKDISEYGTAWKSKV